jgi:hypothetical protein
MIQTMLENHSLRAHENLEQVVVRAQARAHYRTACMLPVSFKRICQLNAWLRS